MAVVQEKKLRKPRVNRLKADEVIEQMRALSHSGPYETLVGLWARCRAEIMAKGKKDRSTETAARESWARLEGFELAAEMVELWASKQTALEKRAIPNPLNEVK